MLKWSKFKPVCGRGLGGFMKRNQMDMCNGPLLGKILIFSLPLIASSVLQLLFNAADAVVVGRFAGPESLAAVGSNNSLINLIINLLIGLSVGANVIVARYFGAQEHEKIGKAVHTAMTVAAVGGLAMGLFGLVFAHQLLQLMGSPDDVINLGTLYLRIYFCGMPGNIVYNFGAAILRAQGDTKRPMIYLTIAGVVNVLLNLFFVIVLKMDVAGVALATIISQYISAVLVVLSLMKEDGPLRLDPKKLGVNGKMLGEMLKIGLPAGLQGIVFNISNVVIQSSVNSFGSTIIAGNAAASSVEGFIYAPLNCIYQTCLTFTSQNMGAGKLKRTDRVLGLCLSCTLVLGLLLGAGSYVFGRQLIGIYSNEAAVIQAGMVRLKMLGITYFLCGFMDVMVGALRGLGFSVVPMIVSMLGACGLRLIWVFTIFQLNPVPQMLYPSYPVSWIVTFLVHLCCWLVIRKKVRQKLESGRLQTVS